MLFNDWDNDDAEMKYAVLSKDPSIEEIAKFAGGFFNRDWKTSKEYKPELIKEFKSKDLKLANNFMFGSIFLYLSVVSSSFTDGDYDKVPKLIYNELMEWDRKGGFCIYLSVLSYCLLYENKVYDLEDLKFIQGYYNHPTHGILEFLCGDDVSRQVGIHSFITVNDAVLDFSIYQEKCCFDFDGNICGVIPEGMELCGWEESHKIVMDYAYEMAAGSKMPYRKWILEHSLSAANIALSCLDAYGKYLDKFGGKFYE